jgi:hypothetical protein
LMLAQVKQLLPAGATMPHPLAVHPV